MNAAVFTLKPIRDLANKGFKPSALLKMEQDAYMQARMALPDAPPEVIAQEAENNLPKGDLLHSYYTQTLSRLMTATLREVTDMADQISLKASALEAAYVRKLASNQDVSLAEKAKLQGAVAQEYATMLAIAQDLEERNIITVAQAPRLQSLTEQPDGPLLDVYQKAIAILNERQQQASRQRLHT